MVFVSGCNQNAFESGVEIGLDVTSDHDALIEEMVDDYVSNLYHDISEGYIALRDGCAYEDTHQTPMEALRHQEIIPAINP